MKTIKELRKESGLSQKKFADYVRIPFRNIQNWEQGYRKPPDYVVDMVNRIIELERTIAKFKRATGDDNNNTIKKFKR